MLALHPAQQSSYSSLFDFSLPKGEPIIDRPILGKLVYDETKICQFVQNSSCLKPDECSLIFNYPKKTDIILTSEVRGRDTLFLSIGNIEGNLKEV